MALTLTDGRYATVQAILPNGFVQVQFYQNTDARARFKSGTNTPFDATYSQVYSPVVTTTTPGAPAIPDVTNADGTATPGTPEVPSVTTSTPITLTETLTNLSVVDAIKTIGYTTIKELPDFTGSVDC